MQQFSTFWVSGSQHTHTHPHPHPHTHTHTPTPHIHTHTHRHAHKRRTTQLPPTTSSLTHTHTHIHTHSHTQHTHTHTHALSLSVSATHTHTHTLTHTHSHPLPFAHHHRSSVLRRARAAALAAGSQCAHLRFYVSDVFFPIGSLVATALSLILFHFILRWDCLVVGSFLSFFFESFLRTCCSRSCPSFPRHFSCSFSFSCRQFRPTTIGFLLAAVVCHLSPCIFWLSLFSSFRSWRGALAWRVVAPLSAVTFAPSLSVCVVYPSVCPSFVCSTVCLWDCLCVCVSVCLHAGFVLCLLFAARKDLLGPDLVFNSRPRFPLC